jgi:2-phospho-L-lactate guanylyltransferase
MRVLVVPVKSPTASKTRLGSVLSADQRAAITLALLQDVLDACVQQPGWEVWVISPDQRVRRLAAQQGGRGVEERGRGLLQAVRQVESEAVHARDLAVVLGDLPYLTADGLALALAADGPVVAAPAASDGGTNLLLRRPPSVIPARFGRASFAKHRWAARRAGIGLAEVHATGLELDLDRPEDVAALLASKQDGRARAACVDMGLETRLVPPADVATKG